MNNDLITTFLWLIALLLYFRMGMRKGYHKGFMDGGLHGAKEMLEILTKRNDSKGGQS